MDVYGPILERALFPAFEAVRGRPTVPLLRFLQRSERWSLEALEDLQAGLLRRLVRHAYTHTRHYRAVLDARGVTPEDISTVEDLAVLPLLDRDIVRETLDARTASGDPRWVIVKTTSGTIGPPVEVKYNAESRNWRVATRWRGYGWAGYRIGMRALHYWGGPRGPESWLGRKKLALDRRLKRDRYVDCVVRSDRALAGAVREIERFEPEVIIAYAAGAAALARFIYEHRLRTWGDIPVIVGAERLWPYERGQIQAALGPAFETYGCREAMLIAAECEQHDGMHTSMENLIVEIVACEPDGTVRAAVPGETGLVVITDLHNLACPMIRYVTGDVAVARPRTRCACGRGLARIGPIEHGRRSGAGAAGAIDGAVC